MFNITCIRKKEYLGMKKKKKKYSALLDLSLPPILPLRGDNTGTGFACRACPVMCIYIFYLIYIKKFPLYFIFISSVSFRFVKYVQPAPNLHHPLCFFHSEEGNGAEMGHP